MIAWTGRYKWECLELGGTELMLMGEPTGLAEGAGSGCKTTQVSMVLQPDT